MWRARTAILGAVVLSAAAACAQHGAGGAHGASGGFHAGSTGGGFHSSPSGGAGSQGIRPSSGSQGPAISRGPGVAAGGPRFAGGQPRSGFGQPVPRGGPLGAPLRAPEAGVPYRAGAPRSSTVTPRPRTPVHYGSAGGVRTYGSAGAVRTVRGGRVISHNGGNSYTRGRYPRRVLVYGGGYGWSGYGYAPWLFYPWLDADLSYNLWYGNDGDAGQPAPAGTAAYDASQQADAAPGAVSGEDASAEDPNTQMHPVAASMDTEQAPATLLFRDGRAPIRTANYVVSAESVTISDSGRVQVVPLGDLDIPATNRLNADAGSGLHLGQ